MSLLSAFHVGPAAEVARAIRERPEAAAEDYPTLDLGMALTSRAGLAVDEIDSASRVLAELRGVGAATISLSAAQVVDGDGNGGQVLRMSPAFVSAFASLTGAEAQQVSGRLVERRLADHRAFQERMRRLVSRPVQSRLDYVAFVALPLFAWLRFRSVALTVAVGAAFAGLVLFALPWWRRRKVALPAVAVRSDEGRAALLGIAELCRTAKRTGQDVVYRWSL